MQASLNETPVYLDIDMASCQQLVMSFLQNRGWASPTLSFADYAIIEEWVQLTGGNSDVLLLVLSETLTPHQAKQRRGLKTLRKTVNSRIKAFQKAHA